jgi:phosphohistidine swiveling domain-containing protein
METPAWAAVVEVLIGAQTSPNPAASYMMLQTVLLVAGPLMLATLYLTAVALMGHAPLKRLAGHFVLSLVPIAIAYHLAHYFSMLAIAGQFIIPLVSDPFGYGWDLFGTTLYRIDIGLVDARFIWYLSVIAIVTGHIIAVWISHATAYAVFDADSAAARGAAGEAVVLVRWETTPDDIHGVMQAAGVLTAHGGMTSHAAVVARGMGKPCVAGCEALLMRFSFGRPHSE